MKLRDLPIENICEQNRIRLEQAKFAFALGTPIHLLCQTVGDEGREHAFPKGIFHLPQLLFGDRVIAAYKELLIWVF